LDSGRYPDGYSTRWEEVMARLLETPLPIIPGEYNADIMIRLAQTIENALMSKEMPSVISGEDDTNGINWFMD